MNIQVLFSHFFRWMLAAALLAVPAGGALGATYTGAVFYKGFPIKNALVVLQNYTTTLTDANGNYSITASSGTVFNYGRTSLTAEKNGYGFSGDSYYYNVSLVPGFTFNGYIFSPVSVPSPGIGAISDVSGTEDTAATVNVTGISNGDSDFAAGIVSVTATSDNTAIVPNPTVSYTAKASTATLTLNPVPNANGAASILVTATRADGATATRTFKYTVAAVNDAPVAGIASAVSFDGINDEVAIDSTGGTITGTFTVETWVRFDSINGIKTVASSRSPSEYGFDFKLMNGGVLLHGDIGDGTKWLTTAADTSFAPILGGWNHIAYVVTPSGYSIYINGVFSASGTYAFSGTPLLINPGHSLRLGSNGGSDFLAGRLAGFRVWTTARTGAQIAEDRNATLPYLTPGLAINLPFLDGSGIAVQDLSVIGPNGTSSAFQNGTLLGGAAFVNNDAGLAAAMPDVAVTEDSPKALYLPALDLDGPAASYSSVTASHGTLTLLSAGLFLPPLYNYAPVPGYVGADTINYTFSDSLLSSSAQIKVNVAAVNDPPVAGPGTALGFNGTDGQVTLASGGSTLSAPFTVEAWVRPDDAAATMAIMGSRAPSDFAFDLKFSGGNKIHADIGNGSGWITTVADAAYSYVPGTWYHVAYAVTSTGYTIYVNGVQAGSGSFGNNTPVLFDSQHVLRLGTANGNAGSVGEYWKGRIADVRLWNTARTAQQIADNRNGSILNDSPNLVAYYRLNEGSALTATDSSTLLGSQAGTLSGGVSWQQFEAPANSLSFNGSQYVSAFDSAGLSVTGPLTVEAWVKPGATGTEMDVVEKYSDTAGGYLLRMLAGGKIQFGTVYNGSITSVTGGTALPPGVWSHIAGTFDGLVLRVFVNGVADGSALTFNGISDGDSALILGARGKDRTFNFNGRIGDVRIWNVARNGADIASYRGGVAPGTAGLVVNYKFTEGSGTAVLNSATAGGAQTGTINPSAPIGTWPGAETTLANLQIVKYTEDTPLSLVLPGFDIEGATLTYSSVSAANGTVAQVSGSKFTYTPSANYNGADVITYAVSDGNTSASAKIYLQGTAVDDPPTIAAIPNQTVSEGSGTSSINISVTDGDPDLTQGLVITAASSNTNLIRSLSITQFGGTDGTAQLNFKPRTGVSGTATITVTVAQAGANLSTSTTFNIIVVGIDDPPNAGPATALQFNGSNYATIPSFGSSAPVDEITIEFWQKATVAVSQNAFVQNPDLQGNRISAQAPSSGGQVIWDFGNSSGSGHLAYTPPVPIIGTWQHFAFVASKSGNYMKIFRNGVEEASKPGMTSFSPNTGELWLGKSFAGQMAEFRVWNAARSGSQILASMHSALPNETANLVAYYRFNQRPTPTLVNFAAATNPNASQNGVLISDGADFDPVWQVQTGSPLRQTSDAELAAKQIIRVADGSTNTLFLPAWDAETSLSSLVWQNASASTGTVKQVSGGNWTYTAPVGHSGTATITYAVKDASNPAVSASLNIQVISSQNAAPTISTLPNTTTEENTSLVEIPFTVGDDQGAANLTITPEILSNPEFIQSIKVLPGGTFRTLDIVPQTDQIGTVHIRLIASDTGGQEAQTEFDLRIEPKPAFSVSDLGVLPAKKAGFGTSINDQGAVAGYMADTADQGGNQTGFYFSGLPNGGVIGENPISQVASDPLISPFRIWSLNNSYAMAGSGKISGQIVGWTKGSLDAAVVSLGGLAGGTNAEIRSLNASGNGAGYATLIGGKKRAILYTVGSGALTDLGLAPAPFNDQSEAYAINASGHVAGAIYSSDGTQRAMFSTNGVLQPLLSVPNDANSVATAVNSFDQVVGSAVSFTAGDIALAFTGTGQSVVQTNLLINPTGSQMVAGAVTHTVEAWIRVDAVTSNRSWPLLLGTPSNGALQWLVNSTSESPSAPTLKVGYFGLGSLPSVPVKLKVWMHLATTYEPVSQKMVVYINGQPYGTNTISGVDLEGIPLTLAKAQGSDDPFNGALDEVRVWNTTRTAAQILANYNVRLTGTETGLVAYFPFDEGFGASTTSAASGHLVAPFTGAPRWTVRSGQPSPDLTVSDPVLQLDGISTYAIGPSLPLANNSFTVEFSAKRSNPNGTAWDMAVSAGSSTANNGLQIGFRPGGVFTFDFWGGGLNTADAQNDTGWHQWAVTFDASTKARGIYRDGVLIANDTAPSAFQGSGPLYFGRASFDPNILFTGALDDIRVWNTARTASQIASNLTTRYTGDTAGLISYFTFDEGGGNIAANHVPGAGDATLQGPATWASRDNGSKRAFLYDSLTGRLKSLGTVADGGPSEAKGINDFGQVVGSAIKGNENAAFFYSAGQMNNLNDLLPEIDQLDQWSLQTANGINRYGAIVGTGLHKGQTRAYLALPASVIGRPVIRPEGATDGRPSITILKQDRADDTDINSFYWSKSENKLYAIRPVIARLAWSTPQTGVSIVGTNFVQNTNSIVSISVNVWPKKPTIHIAGAPVDLQPAYTGSNYTYQTLAFVTNNATVEPSTQVFTSLQPGYTVIQYLQTEGQAINPDTQRPYFEVVRTVTAEDSHAGLTTQTAIIGSEVIDPAHTEYNSKNGYVLYEKAAYDGSGDNRSYDRGTRLGQIIPVNTEKPGGNASANPDPLVVVWYRTNRIGVAWASVPVKYSLQWPADGDVDHLIIASQLGSGMLDEAAYPNKTIYNQPDLTLPGFNPNEEHALMAADTAYAIRHDLNGVKNYSRPYVLIKYQDPLTEAWRMKVYKVVPEEAPYFFNYAGTAGKQIQPPLPLSILNLCANSYMNPPGSLVGWKDYLGKVYARMAGPDGSNTNLVVRWFYPMQPGFFHPDTNVAVGDCLAWLDHHSSNELASPNDGAPITGTPIDTTYNIRWDDVNVLEIGETLLHSKNGLPDVYNMASAQVIFDSLNPANSGTLPNLARFYDPISARTLKTGVSIPTAIKLQNIAGKSYFTDLPWMLKLRLTYDPVNNWLSFGGYLDENFGVGEPLLLPNVLSERERDRIKQLVPGNSTWGTLVDRLYDLTRNPNGVDLYPRDERPDQALRVGLIRDSSGNVVQEPLGSGPKALTSGIGGTPAAQPQPGNALNFDGTSGVVTVGLNQGQNLVLANTPFTIEFWAKRSGALTEQYIMGQPSGSADFGRLRIGFRAGGQFAFDLGTTPSSTSLFNTGTSYTDTGWHHWACTFDPNTKIQTIYRDGFQALSRTNLSLAYNGFGVTELGRFGNNYFNGKIDEVRVWTKARTASEIRAQMNKRLLGVQTAPPAGAGSELGLVLLYRCDEAATSSTVVNASLATAGGYLGTFSNSGVSLVTSDAPAGIPPRYITLAENNDASLAGLPVTLYVIRVDDGPFLGDLKVLPGDNVFDERLTIRHSSDFGGDPGPLVFQWYYKPIGADFDPTDLPVVTDPTADPSDMRGWLLYTSATPKDGHGVNYITIGEGGESGLLTLSDNAFVCRYKGYAVNLADSTAWSGWVGDPTGTPDQPRAALGEGWVKRVIRGLNPFDARTADFHSSASDTYSSMLIQAGKRYEGPIAFNPSADAINSVGLIEAYTTVLQRAAGLSINGVPQVDFNPANNALLLAATKISDLYMVLGNEAYADAADPTIGFGSSSQEYGSLSSSIFCFQNQLDSLLDEELGLLRGRDDSAAGVGGRPVYNRLFWNFTLGEGEVAYQQNYNISDQNKDGFIDEKDAAILYPQGHGDAWGHYLTAVMQHYDLLRHPYFTWIPRSELVNVAGAAIKVDFLDERKFASAAAAKAAAGANIVDLTYRLNYVDDPAGQWQGYKDTDPNRAWGVTEWARRAGTGAYFDWLTGNTILPSVDPNPEHTGIDKIDRQTVRELQDIAANYDQIQNHLDQADAGLNPLGLAKGAVPFDIDPSLITTTAGVPGKTHYEQIQDRATKAMNNALSVWDQVNKATQALRQNQDSVEQFANNVIDQERDYKNRLIEIYGYPYAGDIGAGQTYPSDYDGPDLYHYIYIDAGSLDGDNGQLGAITGYFTPLADASATTGKYAPAKYFADDVSQPDNALFGTNSVFAVNFPYSPSSWAFRAPSGWGARRASGEIQMAIQDCVQADTRMKQAVIVYQNQIRTINDSVTLLKAHYALQEDFVEIKNTELSETRSLSRQLAAVQALEGIFTTQIEVTKGTVNATTEAIPKVVGLATDALSFSRSMAKYAGVIANGLYYGAVAGLKVGQSSLQTQLRQAKFDSEIGIQTANFNYEVQQQLLQLQQLMRQEAVQRAEVLTQIETLSQMHDRYLAALAKGQRLVEERVVFRQRVAAQTTESRYTDMTFRIFRNDALQKYRAAFDLAQRYVYLAATAYDYESNLLGTDSRSGRAFLTDIIRQRALGQMINGVPAIGRTGLADPLARMSSNFDVLKSQLGFNNPQTETGRFSLRNELFRLNNASDDAWRAKLQTTRVANLWDVPEFRRFCRSFAPESSGVQPGLVIRFPSTVTAGRNFFNWPLGGGDSAYDSSRFATKVRSAGIWFSDYNGTGLSVTPRVYLVPVGEDILSSPVANDFTQRNWRVIDQALPVPFPIGANTLSSPSWIPVNDSLGGSFADIRRFASFRAYHDSGSFDPNQVTSDSRLVGRSVWNSEWMLIIPGQTFLADANSGLDTFINSVSDIKLFFQTYSYSGN